MMISCQHSIELTFDKAKNQHLDQYGHALQLYLNTFQVLLDVWRWSNKSSWMRVAPVNFFKEGNQWEIAYSTLVVDLQKAPIRQLHFTSLPAQKLSDWNLITIFFEQ